MGSQLEILIIMGKGMIAISIKAARKRKNMTQCQLAKEVGVHQTNVVAWERGKWSPTAQRLLKLSRILDCSVDELLAPDNAASHHEAGKE
mgnify:CR=1 FL=1